MKRQERKELHRFTADNLYLTDQAILDQWRLGRSTTAKLSDVASIRRHISNHVTYLPSPEDIERECSVIRSTWSKREEQLRASGMIDDRAVVPVYSTLAIQESLREHFGRPDV